MMPGFLASAAYSWRVTRRGLLLILGALLLILAATLLIPTLLKNPTAYSDFADGGLFTILVAAFLYRCARKDTPYLVTRPVSRRAIWLGTMAHFITLALTLALARVLYALLGYGANFLIIRAGSPYHTFAGADAWNPFVPSHTPSAFWSSLSILLRTGLMAYLYGCLMRRWKGWTITLTILIPAGVFLISVLPWIYLFLHDVRSLSDSASLSTVYPIAIRWIEAIQSIMQWLDHNITWLTWAVAAVCAPLSFLVMRTTRYLE
jgi:hypothetical protein